MPKFNLLNDARMNELSRDIMHADLKMGPEEYVHYAFIVSLVISAGLTWLFSGIISDVALLPLLFILFVVVLVLLSLRIPKIVARNRAFKVEADLPIQLRAISTELAIGIPFESALESAASSGDSTQPIFRSILSDLRNGMSPAEAMARARTLVDSRMLDKVLSHLTFLYSYGYEGSGLAKLVEEISAEHRAKIREFA